MDRIVEDIIEYEHTDSELAKYTIVSLHNRINNLEKENQKLREALQTDKLMKAFMVEHNRNEKAIEYIKYATENDDVEELKNARHLLLYNEDLDKLLNILKGDDENVK